MSPIADRSLGFNISTSEDLTRAAAAMVTSLEKLNKTVDKLDGKVARIGVKLDGNKEAEAGLDNTERKRKELDGKTARVKVDIDKKQLTDTINSFGMLARNMQGLALPAGVALATPTILALGQAAAVTSQSLLLLPAAGVAAGIVFGTIKLGVSGLGLAFKDLAKGDMAKFGEDLKKLSPEAREFAQSVLGIKPAFDSMRLDVQNELFDGLGKKVSVLGHELLPMMDAGMVSVAGSLNNMADGIFNYIQNSNALSSVQTIFDNIAEAMFKLEPTGAAIVSIFINLATVGSEFLPALADGLNECAQRAADFVAEARESGKLHEWISNGLSALGLLAQIFINVGSIIHAVFVGLHSDSDDFLTSIRDMTAKVADFLNSGQGQTILVDVFTKLQMLAGALMPLLGAIALGALNMVTTLAPAIGPLVQGILAVLDAARPLTQTFLQLAVEVLPPLGAALQFLAPVLGPILAAFIIAKTVTAAWAVATAVATAAQLAFSFVMGAITVATYAYNIAAAIVRGNINLWATAQWLLNAAMEANPIGVVVVVLGLLVAAVILAYNHSETFRKIVTAAWQGIKDAASTAWAWLQGIFASFMEAVHNVGGWFAEMAASISRAWSDIQNAAGTAWGWLVTNVWQPMIDFFTVSIPAAWNSLVATVQAVWNGIIEVLKYAVAIILTIVLFPLMLFINEVFPGGLNNLLAIWKAIWQGMLDTLQSWWNFAKGIWGLVVTFVTQTLPAAFQLFVSVATALWEGLKDTLNRWWIFVQSLWLLCTTFLTGAFTLAFRVFMAAVTAVWDSLKAILIGWWNTIAPLWNAVISFLSGPFTTAHTVMRIAVTAIWNLLRDTLSGVWNFIRDNLWNPMVTFITRTIPDSFRTGVDAVGRLWNAIKAALRTPLQAAIDIVWNNGIMKVWGAVTDLVHIPNNLHEYHLAPAAAGRVVDTIPGYTPGRDPHTFYSPSAHASIALSGGESIMRPEFTAAVGKQQVNQINAVARRGGSRAVQAFLQYGGEGLSDFGGFANGAAALSWARGQVGKPYIWTGVGPRGYDCSGFQSAVTNVALGQNPYSRRFATSSFGPNRGAGGFVPGINGSYAIGVNPKVGGGPGHMAGTLMGVNIESSSGPGVRVGGGAKGADNALFPWKFHLPEIGGQFVSGGGGGGGGGGPSAFDILSGAWKTVTDTLGKLGSIGGGPWGGAAGGFLTKSATAIWDYVKEKAMAIVSAIGGAIGGAFSGGGLTGGIGGMVSGIANAFGWRGAQLDAINWIIQKESGGNPTAQNPHSTAYGLFQFLDSTWAGTGVAKTSDPSKQILAGLNYIKKTYHDPLGAQAFWQSHGWYDTGGYLMPGRTMAMNATGQRERVLDPMQTRIWDAVVSSGRRTGGSDDPLIAELRQQNKQLRMLRGDVDQSGSFGALISEVRALRRDIASVQNSAVATSQSARTQSEFGAW